ncbi:MAG: prolipoprotein diacylglyceryl transferase [Propionibacteriaceae bacterium]|nr:prolipoprotein diacylglyceryl transferase [Propionibacteriaceae bacterium]
MIGLYIPPPPFRDLFHIGPLNIHMYSLTMVTAIIVAFVWSTRRVVQKGGDADAFEGIGLAAVICGVIGARLYHVITQAEWYFGPGRDPWNALRIWDGGLGVIGSIIGGALAVWVICRRKGISTADVTDAIAPTVLVAQAIGRVGNYFNQEAFGKPTTLPWGLKVDPAYRPAGYSQYETFHPTFVYEGLWNLLGCVLILWAERRFKLQHGKVITLYVMWYSFGRFFIELIRIDPVTVILGVRINNWTDGIIFLAAVAVFILLMRRFPGSVDQPLAGMGEKWRAKKGESVSSESKAAEDDTVDADDAPDGDGPPDEQVDEPEVATSEAVEP